MSRPSAAGPPETPPIRNDRGRRGRRPRGLVVALVLWFGLTGAGIAYLALGLLAPVLGGVDPTVAGAIGVAVVLTFGLVSAPVIRALL